MGNIYDAYRNRVFADGETIKEATESATKRQMINYILDSPSLSSVFIDLDMTLPIPCIVSDVRTFYYRRFLFLPDMKINLGDYIQTDDELTYLATDKSFDNLYPQLFGELCNIEFPIKTTVNKILIGYDAMKRPQYREEIVNITKPAVLTDKIYSQANNSPMPLPDGAIIVKIPYSENNDEIPKVNTKVALQQGQYSISTISYEYVIKGIGYLEVQLQREQNT